ncbi:MAG: hypothetical protein QXY87_01895 [Saccharolobus sp.]|nr:hypothetical protein [Saccharolobus shibatae]MCH4814333.1 hypothetical protein [Saccharolobus shibatae]
MVIGSPHRLGSTSLIRGADERVRDPHTMHITVLPLISISHPTLKGKASGYGFLKVSAEYGLSRNVYVKVLIK